ncbi:ABC transporter permease [Paenibacillus endoradicis]|uniref:ABC transporter permease n=1 Tax=Paenibacillus endoradicis TaxID=2972487 RepID=UPI002158BA5C|nr:ABC transporter permease [Paenibacillus endoradicis]MCR8657568.1 ABC transporter permease [Paenibacillus endoradicis]
MSKWIHIVIFRIRYMLKSPANIVLLFVMPIAFSLIYGNLNFGEGSTAPPKVAIVVAHNELGQETAKLLSLNPQYDWIEAESEEARELVADQKVIAAVIVPDDLTERLRMGDSLFEIIVNKKVEQYIALANIVISTSNNLYNLSGLLEGVDGTALIDAVKTMNSQHIVQVNEVTYGQYVAEQSSGGEEATSQALTEESLSMSATLAIGFSIMFMMFALSGSAAIIHNERRDYTWQRLTTTPATGGSIVGGYITSFWLIGWLQFAIIMIFMTIVFGTSWGNLILLIPFVSIMILTIVAYSMMMATVVSSKKQADAVNSIIIVSTCMLGGVYWPVEIMPQFMQYIANFIPQYWMMQGLEYIMLDQTSGSTSWQPWAVLCGISGVFLAIAIRQLTKEQRV